MIKFDNTIKLDHLITLFGVLFSLGVFYNMMMTGLASKADKAVVEVNSVKIEQNAKDLMLLRGELQNSMTRIEGHLIRIEQKMERKVDKP